MDNNNNNPTSNTPENTNNKSALNTAVANAVAANASAVADSTPPSLFRSTTDALPIPTNTTAPNTNDMYTQFAQKIIKEQEGIIGPIAYEQASKVPGLTIDPKTHIVMLEGDKKMILENLVKQYELLFGRVSIEICKEAVRSDIATTPRDQIPQVLL
jgi:hypothetical protein